MTAATSSAQASSTTGVNADLVEKAVSALLKHHEQETAKSSAEKGTLPLLGVDRPLQVQIGLDRVPSVHAHKPTRILIPHPLYKVALVESDEAATETHTASDAGVEEPSVCLIVKEESKPWVKEMVTRFQKYMGCVQKVMGLDSLRKKHSRYEQRRELLQKYDVFLADDRILPMLGKALGRDFYKHKKLPIPIKLTRKEALPFAVQKALTATFVTLSQGTCVTIRAGNTGMPINNLVENIVAICENAAPKIPRKWANIRSIAIKTPESMALPIYNKTPEELVEIARLAGLDKKRHRSEITKEEEDGDEGNENETQEKDKQESEERKKKTATKSPLVRAVKRQLEDAKEKAEASPTKKHKTATKGTVPAEEKETEAKGKNETKDQSETERHSSKKKRKSGVDKASSQGDHKATYGSAKELNKEATKESKANGDFEAPRSGKSPKLKQEAESIDEMTPKNKKAKSDKSAPGAPSNETPSTKKDKSAKKDTEDASKSKKKNESSSSKKDDTKFVSTPSKASEPATFMPSPKFKGSKSGYVFKTGKLGVGYYVDVKSVVDPMVLEAFARTSKKSPASGGRSKVKRSSGMRKARHSR